MLKHIALEFRADIVAVLWPEDQHQRTLRIKVCRLISI